MDEHLIKQVKKGWAVTLTAGAAAATPINGAIIDTLGFGGVCFSVGFGAIVGGAVTSIKAQWGNASNLSDAEDIEGTAQTIADTKDDKMFYIDVLRPKKRYVRLVVSRGTQNATVVAIYNLYKPDTKPTVQSADVDSGELFTDAIAGTA